MKNKNSSKILSYLILVLSLFFILVTISDTLATTETHEIYNFNDLIEAAELSRTSAHNEDVYILMNDINITEEDYASIAEEEYNYVSFGSSDVKFAGIFDGNGYTISGLKYSSTLAVRTDTALFSYVSGATIRNLTIDDADLQADYRGAIVAGSSENSLYENILVKDSHIRVTAIDNVLTLITDGGIRGGAIIGESSSDVLYNCESNNNMVNTNNTSGVAALSGKGLTLGALIGISNNTVVEYSRVYGGTVKSYYDVAVGALGGNTLYVGGIIGRMRGTSKVIDSFSTATLDYYCATYVSVGAGNVGHIGGITAEMNGSSNEILRSHYAGVATSKQYNAALVIPIIQNNLNISGIADVYDGGAVSSVYFKPSMNPNVKMNVLGNSSTTSLYGPQTDDRYADRNFWQNVSYDFYGNINRNTEYSSKHHNKWVMNSDLGIPIHGKSISATLNYPVAGNVQIARTDLVSTAVTTTNPYVFAVQGMYPNEVTTSLTATAYNGYRFVSWYKLPDVVSSEIEEDNEYFLNIFSQNSPVSSNANYQDVFCDDNDLFIAYYQSQVLFHDINGNLIDKDTGDVESQINNVKDWYDYKDELPDVTPLAAPSSSNAILVGWTTERSSEAGGGYSAITASELSTLKANDDFYEAGYVIDKPLELYPIYVDLISNVKTVFEGHEQDSLNDESQRVGVGSTSATLNQDDTITINVTGANSGSFPEGYRFLGWYNEDGLKVSNSKNYTIEQIDLTNVSTFTARFEYKVSYYVKAFAQNNGRAYNTSELFTEKWNTYNSEVENIGGPAYIRESVVHWGTSHVNHGNSDPAPDADAYTTRVTEPVSVYSHNNNTVSNSGTGYQGTIDNNFPGSGSIKSTSSTNGADFEFTPVDANRYHLLFWTLERPAHLGDEYWSYANNPMTSGSLNSTVTYQGRAFVVTDIVFHDKSDNTTTLTRRYEDDVFVGQSFTHTYKFPFIHTSVDVNTRTADSPAQNISNQVTIGASPTNSSMNVNGYAFLGWISSKDVAPNSSEWNMIYDVQGDSYTTSSVSRVKPYLIDTDEVVRQTMDLYPVYAKYNITTETNVVSNNLPSDINVPSNPTYTLQETQNLGEAKITVTPDTETYVYGNSGEKFTLSSITVNCDGVETELTVDSNDEYTLDVVAGKNYVITANYEPYIVVYHVSNSSTSVVVKDEGSTLGDIPIPTEDLTQFDINNKYIYKGYTKEKPTTNNYHIFSSYNDYLAANIKLVSPSTMVNESFELWPVYIATNVSVQSNIDDYLDDNSINKSYVYSLDRNTNDKLTLSINDNRIGNYSFMGWYKNYVDDTHPGDLISISEQYNITGDEPFSNILYTAVYKKVYEVKYYGLDGNVIYQVDVSEDEHRSFISESLDEDNNPVYTMLDYAAYELINRQVSAPEAFKNWYWLNNNTVVNWDDFKDDEITSNMNIYPITTSVQITDYNNENVVLSGDNPRIIIGNNKDGMYASLNEAYLEDKLTYTASYNVYGKNGAVTTAPLQNESVTFYPSNDTSVTSIGEGVTNSSGTVQFSFKDKVVIRKIDSNNKTDYYIFRIIKRKDNSVVKRVIVPNGGDVTVLLPYGAYNAECETTWSWRYRLNTNGNLNVNNTINPIQTFTDNGYNNKWFSSMDLNSTIHQ